MHHYKFPEITHIDQVLAAIQGDDNFKVRESLVEGQVVRTIDYMMNTLEAFPEVTSDQDALRRECRGIMFDASGALISRPYHKFFNLGERPETQENRIDFHVGDYGKLGSKGHHILRKLDGSMVRTIPTANGFRLGTKAGITGVAEQAEAWLFHPSRSSLVAKIQSYLSYGDRTVIFEWCSRQQRIVLDYPEEKLILTAIRSNRLGTYTAHSELKGLGDMWGVDVVDASTPHETLASLKAATNAEEHQEGWVIRFFSGHMLKIKSDWYVLRHRTKDSVALEKNVLALIYNNEIDDVLPLLCDSDRERITAFQTQVLAGLDKTIKQWTSDFEEFKSKYDRKTFAVEVAPTLSDNQKAIMFKCWDGRYDVSQAVDLVMLKVFTSASKVNENRDLWGGAKYASVEDV